MCCWPRNCCHWLLASDTWKIDWWLIAIVHVIRLITMSFVLTGIILLFAAALFVGRSENWDPATRFHNPTNASLLVL